MNFLELMNCQIGTVYTSTCSPGPFLGRSKTILELGFFRYKESVECVKIYEYLEL